MNPSNFLRIFPNGNELHFNYVNGEPAGDAVLSNGNCREEFKFVDGQKQVRDLLVKAVLLVVVVVVVIVMIVAVVVVVVVVLLLLLLLSLLWSLLSLL